MDSVLTNRVHLGLIGGFKGEVEVCDWSLDGKQKSCRTRESVSERVKERCNVGRLLVRGREKRENREVGRFLV